MSNPYIEWKYFVLKDASELSKAWEKVRGKIKSVGFDTEATGLHIKKDKPFLFQIGWNREVYMFEPKPSFMKVVFDIFRNVNYVFAHNIKYDLNMLCNLGYEEEVFQINTWCDTMAIFRLSLEAKSPRDGGDTLKLKYLGVKYIHPYANNSEKMIDEAMTNLNKERVKFLTAALKQFDKEGEFTATGRQRKWGKKDVEDFLKNPVNELEDLPTEVREVWTEWQKEYPEPTYADIDKEIMYKYAGEDVATMLMLVELMFPTLMAREQYSTLQRERKCILPTLKMEREGLPVDFEYLETSRIRVRDYIRELRSEMEEIAGRKVTVGQHALIIELFDTLWGVSLDSADAKNLGLIKENFNGLPKRFAELIISLRTAEKWYSTYIKRIQQNASYDGRVYTQINLSGAISGRMSSDLQQFPRKGFKHIDTGEELYNPRRAFKVGGEDSKGKYSMVYIDYDQIELVTQAHYCITIKAEGTNLVRAYMPYKCRHYITGEEYGYMSPEGRTRWNEVREDGKTTVWLTETGELWSRTDLHTLTASEAYPNVDTSSEYFQKELRPKGKTTNFSSNYGGSAKALMDNLMIPLEEAKRLVDGYNRAFPEVKYYQEMIQKAHAKKGYIRNIFGRRYYLKNNRDSYKLANAAVQGSCADALKEAIIDIFPFLQAKDSCMVLPVHDELSFKVYEHEREIIPILLDKMEKVFHWCLVPVTAGVEISDTYWSEKKEMEI